MIPRVAGLAAGCLLGTVALAGCSSGSGGEAVDLPSRSPAAGETSPGGTSTFEPQVPEGSAPPTLGLPTEARAELRGADDLDPDVLGAWRAYQEALSESLRAHEPTSDLRATAGAEVVQMVQERGPRDEADGLTVGLRPLGRLESVRVAERSATLRTCLWAPSVGFFVEATGEEAEGGDPGWVEYDTRLTREGSRWTVSSDERTGRTCAGGAP